MAERLTLKVINQELARIGSTARLAKGSGYFCFQFGEAVNWLDRTINVPKVSALSLERWVQEYRRLKKLNSELMKPPARRSHQS